MREGSELALAMIACALTDEEREFVIVKLAAGRGRWVPVRGMDLAARRAIADSLGDLHAAYLRALRGGQLDAHKRLRAAHDRLYDPREVLDA